MSRKSALLVFSNPVAGREDEYNEWYDNVHVPEILDIPGVISAQRYETTAEDSDHAYLATYEIDGDPTAVVKELNRRIGAGEITLSEAIDLSTVSMSTWNPRQA